MSQERLNLLALAELYHPVVGGSVRWIAKIAEHWPGRARVLAGMTPQGSVQPTPKDGPAPVDRIRLRLRDWGLDGVEGLMQYAGAIPRVALAARRHGAEAILCGRGVPEGFIACAASRLSTIPYGCLVHGEEVVSCGLSGQLRRMLRLAYSRASFLVCNSRSSASLALSAGGRPERIIVSHPGVEVRDLADLRAVERPDLPDRQAGQAGATRPLTLLTVGRLDERKNHAGVLRAMALLAGRGVDLRYVVVGDGDQQGRLARLAGELGLADRVRWVHGGGDEIVTKAYSQADIFVMPAVHTGRDIEGFGIVFIEAGLAGLPCVAGRVGGCGEAVLDGQTGLVVDGADSQALADALQRLAGDADLRREMGRAGRRRACQELDWRVLIPRLACDVERMIRDPERASRT